MPLIASKAGSKCYTIGDQGHTCMGWYYQKQAALSVTCFTISCNAGAGRKPQELSNDEKLCAHHPEGTVVAASCGLVHEVEDVWVRSNGEERH